MKQPIEWYQACLLNHAKTVAALAQRSAMAVDDYTRSLERYRFMERQIAEAKRRGMTAFDADRLMLPRKKKENQ